MKTWSSRLKKLKIDPELFTDDQWYEAANVDADNLLKTDRRAEAKTRKATKAKIIALASYCYSKAARILRKAARILRDELGKSDAFTNTTEWALDLGNAARILLRITEEAEASEPKGGWPR